MSAVQIQDRRINAGTYANSQFAQITKTYFHNLPLVESSYAYNLGFI